MPAARASRRLTMSRVEQVDLGRAPGALADHHVEAGAQVGAGASSTRRQQLGLGGVIVDGVEVAPTAGPCTTTWLSARRSA